MDILPSFVTLRMPAHAILTLEGIGGVRGRHGVICSGVINVGLEQCRCREQTLVEQLPLGAHLYAARLAWRNNVCPTAFATPARQNT